MDASRLRATLAATSALRTRAESRAPKLRLPAFSHRPSQLLVGLSLIDALLIICDDMGHAAERDQLLAALPQVNDDLNPVAAPLSLARVELHGAWGSVQRKSLAQQQIPFVAQMRNGGYVAVTKRDDHKTLQLRAAGFSGVCGVADLADQMDGTVLVVQTRAASLVTASAAEKDSRPNRFRVLRHVCRNLQVQQGFPASRIAASLFVNLLIMTFASAAVYGIALAGNGMLATIPLAAIMSVGLVFFLHQWRKQRDWQMAPALVASLRGVFLRGSLMRQTISQDDFDGLSRASANHLISVIRTAFIDVPVGLLGWVLIFLVSPGWMVESSLPTLALLAYAVLSLIEQKRQSAGLIRLCRAMAYAESGTSERIRGDLALDNASVVADTTTSLILSGISLRIRAGEHVGIIGGMGSGKSSLLHALAGHFALEEGRRYIDGQPRAAETDPLRSEQVFFAPQETALISGSLAENILMGRPRPLPGMLDWIMRTCNLASVGGKSSDAILSEQIAANNMLSSGERHAIGLARALVGDPPVLLLDDPTSAMDAQSERTFLSALINNTTRRTIVIASNRQSVLRLLDRIIWIENGKIISDKSRDVMLQELKTQAPYPRRTAA